MEIEYLEAKDPYGFIYITTNLVNGMRYLGQKKFDRIWKTYLGSGSIIRKAIKKYGKENFRRDIVCVCYSPEELNKVEYDLSVFFNVVDDDNWYNLCYGGGSTSGYKRSDEEKAMLSRIVTERMANPEVRERLRQAAKERNWVGERNPNYGNHKLAGENNPNYGKKASEETLQKMRYAASNRSEETRKKLSDSAKARMTPEVKEHLRQINTGRKVTDEQREKMSQSQLARWTDELREEYSIKYSGEGNPMYGRHHSEETKEKLREMFSGEKSCMYGKHPSEETIQKMIENSPLKKAVVQLDMQGNYIAEYQSMGEAGRVTGISEGHICTAIKTRKSAGGYMWIHKENYNPDEVITYTNNRFVPVVQIDKNGNYIAEYCSTHEAERKTNVLSQNIGKCCREKHRTAGGYFWRYLSEYDVNEVFKYKTHERTVVQLNLNYGFIAEYSSLTNAANATGFLQTSIRSCCAKINKTLHGYRWMYIEDYEELLKQNKLKGE